MGVRISRELDGRVSIAVTGEKRETAIVSSIEARLLAIKLLLAAEELKPASLAD